MATSGSDNFKITRAQAIEHALKLIGIKGIGKTLSGEDIDNAQMAANLLIKSWQKDHPHIWGVEEAYLFLNQYDSDYTLGNGARAALVDDSVITRLDAALVALDTSVTVEDTTGMSATDPIGIVQDDGSTHWTTISSVDSSTTLTLTTGVVSAAAVDNLVYSYSSTITKPLEIYHMRRLTGFDSSSSSTLREIEVEQIARQQYNNLPNKTSNSTTVTHFYYQPELTSGSLKIWPRVDDTSLYLRFTYARQLEDLDSQGDDLDLPAEWHETFVYQLALRLAPMYGKEAKARILIEPIAQSLMAKLLAWDTERRSIYLSYNDDDYLG